MISSLREDGDTEFMNVLANELVPQVWNEDLIDIGSFPFPDSPGCVCVCNSGQRKGGGALPAGWKR